MELFFNTKKFDIEKDLKIQIDFLNTQVQSSISSLIKKSDVQKMHSSIQNENKTFMNDIRTEFETFKTDLLNKFQAHIIKIEQTKV